MTANPLDFRRQERRRRIAWSAGALLFVIAAVILVASLWAGGGKHATGVQPQPVPNPPKAYKYGSLTATNGMALHFLRTSPSNVTLTVIQNNVTLAPYYGINGGFFYQTDLMSMAVVNDKPVNGEANAFGAGVENVKYARGTLVWDAAAAQLSVQVVKRADELNVSDRSQYWAQGGISMSIGRDENWYAQALAENAPFALDPCLRSAAVFDEAGNLYLVVSTTRGTLEAFRQAILEQLGTIDGLKLKDGIFLDGDGSSQLRSTETSLPGDNRPVVQMLSLLH